MFDCILVCGPRDATYEEWGWVVGRTIAKHLVLGGTIIHGNAKGIDRMSQTETEELNRSVEVYPADWEKHGKSAGPIRNNEMKNRLLELEAEGNTVAVFAFTNDITATVGTKNMATSARRSGLPLFVFSSDGKCKEY